MCQWTCKLIQIVVRWSECYSKRLRLSCGFVTEEPHLIRRVHSRPVFRESVLLKLTRVQFTNFGLRIWAAWNLLIYTLLTIWTGPRIRNFGTKTSMARNVRHLSPRYAHIYETTWGNPRKKCMSKGIKFEIPTFLSTWRSFQNHLQSRNP